MRRDETLIDLLLNMLRIRQHPHPAIAPRIEHVLVSYCFALEQFIEYLFAMRPLILRRLPDLEVLLDFLLLLLCFLELVQVPWIACVHFLHLGETGEFRLL